MTEPLALYAGIASVISSVEKILAFTREATSLDSIRQDLPLLIGLLHDANNIFINSTEPIPKSAKEALGRCHELELQLNSLIHKWMGRQPVLRLWGHVTIERGYAIFKSSVLLLNEIATTSMVTQIKHQQIQAEQLILAKMDILLDGQRRLEIGLQETMSITYRVLEHTDKGKSAAEALGPDFWPESEAQTDLESRQRVPNDRETHQDSSSLTAYRRGRIHEPEFNDDIDENSLLLQQRDLQLGYPNDTVFTAVICSAIESGQCIKRSVARCKLDTGADVNIIAEEYVLAEGLNELIVQIAEREQAPIGGIEGFSWTPKRKITLKFYLVNSIKIETAEFFVAAGLGWDLLISQKYYAPITEAMASKPKYRVLFLPRLRRTAEQVASQREFDQQREKEREAATKAYEEREALKRLQKRQHYLTPSYTTGRAWTLHKEGISGRAMLPAPTSSIGTRESHQANYAAITFPEPPEPPTNGESSGEYEMGNLATAEVPSDATPLPPSTFPKSAPEV